MEEVHQKPNGEFSTYFDDFKTLVNDVSLNRSLSAQTQYYGSIPTNIYNNKIKPKIQRLKQ